MELSEFLISLQSVLGGDVPDKFRNPNGVYMKLMNLRRFDPDYDGKGLERGSQDEEVVWDLYAEKPIELRRISDSIRSFVSSDAGSLPGNVLSDDEEEAEEGALLTRTHRVRERNTRIVKSKKELAHKESGTLACEVCGFDFVEVYGDRGYGFIECHHTKPVSELKVGERTKLSDLSVICSNCHRMIHAKRPWLSVSELKGLLK